MLELYDGIRLHFLENEKFNTACIAVILRLRLSRDEVTLNALLTRVLSAGCQKYRNITEINQRLDLLLGAAFNCDVMKKGSEHLIELFCEVSDSERYVKDALSFIGEILFSPIVKNNAFLDDIVENEKKKLKNNILGLYDDKKEYAKQQMLEKMCGESPFGIYGGGYVDDIEKITSYSLYEHYKKVISDCLIEILIMTSSKKKPIKQKCRELFDIDSRNAADLKLHLPFTSSDNKKTIHTTEESINQTKLCIGMQSGVKPFSESFFPLLLGNEILGGSGNSKLFLNLREKESLCYYINSYIYRFSGIMCIQSGINSDKLNKALELIDNEIEKVKKGDFSDDEIENAKKTLIKNLLTTYDYNSSLMDFRLANILTNENETIKSAVKIISSADRNSVVKAFKDVKINTIYTLGAS